MELCRNFRPPHHDNPHPDPGGAHAVCPCTQTIRRGHTCPLPCEMAGEICPHRQRQGSKKMYLPRPVPSDPKPSNTGHMPSHAGAYTIFSDPTLHWGPVWRSPVPTLSEAPPHTTGDTRPNVTTRPGHTAKPNTSRQHYRGRPKPAVGYPPQPRHFPAPIRGTRGNRHSTRGSHGRYCCVLIRRIRVPTLESMLHLLPTAP